MPMDYMDRAALERPVYYSGFNPSMERSTTLTRLRRIQSDPGPAPSVPNHHQAEDDSVKPRRMQRIGSYPQGSVNYYFPNDDTAKPRRTQSTGAYQQGSMEQRLQDVEEFQGTFRVTYIVCAVCVLAAFAFHQIKLGHQGSQLEARQVRIYRRVSDVERIVRNDSTYRQDEDIVRRHDTRRLEREVTRLQQRLDRDRQPGGDARTDATAQRDTQAWQDTPPYYVRRPSSPDRNEPISSGYAHTRFDDAVVAELTGNFDAARMSGGATRSRFDKLTCDAQFAVENMEPVLYVDNKRVKISRQDVKKASYSPNAFMRCFEDGRIYKTSTVELMTDKYYVKLCADSGENTNHKNTSTFKVYDVFAKAVQGDGFVMHTAEPISANDREMHSLSGVRHGRATRIA